MCAAITCPSLVLHTKPGIRPNLFSGLASGSRSGPYGFRFRLSLIPQKGPLTQAGCLNASFGVPELGASPQPTGRLPGTYANLGRVD
jgi:hypothetical protein